MWEFEIALAADFSIIIPLFLFIVRRPKELPLYYKYIITFLLLFFIRNAATFILGELNIYNMYVYNWSNLFSSLIIGLLYYSLFKNKNFKRFSVLCILLSVGSAFLDYESLFNSATTHFNRFSYNISGCSIIILTLIYFYQLLRGLQVTNLTAFPLFWFSSGALIYYSGTVFSYLYVNYTFNNPDLAIVRSYWMIDALLFIVFCVFLSLSVWYMTSAESSE
jgi:hypothetical protein